MSKNAHAKRFKADITNPDSHSSLQPSPDTCSAHFASNRKYYDILAGICTGTVMSTIALSRTFSISQCQIDRDSACSRDPLLNTFPTESTPMAQAAWTARRVLWLPWHLAIHHNMQVNGLFVLLGWVIAVIAWRQPRVYLQGGRTCLVLAFRAVTIATGLATVLLDSSEIQKNFTTLGFSGTGGLKCFIWMNSMWQLPLPLLCKIAPLEILGISIITTKLSQSRDPADFLIALLLHSLGAFVFPVLLSELSESCTFKWAFLNAAPARSHRAASSGSAAASSGVTPQHDAPVPPPGPSGLPSDVNLLEISDILSQVPGALSGVLEEPFRYRRTVSTQHITMKVHHHSAFEQRTDIISGVERVLIQSTAGSQLLGVHTMAWQGCLQLVTTLTELPPSPIPPSSSPPANAYTPPDAIIDAILRAVPATCNQSDILIHMPSSQVAVTRKGGIDSSFTKASSSPTEPTAAVGNGGGGSSFTTVSPLLTEPTATAVSSTPVGLDSQVDVSPFCLVAGSAGPLEVVLEVGAALVEASRGEAVEVVIGYRKQQEQQVVRFPVDNLIPGIRFSLPACLDAGPVSAFIMSTQSGRAGALLGACTSLALPQPAAEELCSLHQQHSSHPDGRHSLRDLLQDVAAVWRALAQSGSETTMGSGTATGPRPGDLPVVSCATQGLVKDLTRVFLEHRLVSCVAELQQLLSDALRLPPARSNEWAMSESTQQQQQQQQQLAGQQVGSQPSSPPAQQPINTPSPAQPPTKPLSR